MVMRHSNVYLLDRLQGLGCRRRRSVLTASVPVEEASIILQFSPPHDDILPVEEQTEGSDSAAYAAEPVLSPKQIQRSVRRRSPAAKHAQVRSRSGSNRDSEAPAEPRAGCQRDDTSHADAAGRRALLLLRSVAAARQSLAAHAVGFGAAGVIITIAACAYAQAVKLALARDSFAGLLDATGASMDEAERGVAELEGSLDQLAARFAVALAVPAEAAPVDAVSAEDDPRTIETETEADLAAALIRVAELEGEVAEARDAAAAAVQDTEAAATNAVTAARLAGELVAAAEAGQRAAVGERDAAQARAAAADARVAHAKTVADFVLAAAEVVVSERDAARAETAALLRRVTRLEAQLAAAAVPAQGPAQAEDAAMPQAVDALARVDAKSRRLVRHKTKPAGRKAVQDEAWAAAEEARALHVQALEELVHNPAERPVFALTPRLEWALDEGFEAMDVLCGLVMDDGAHCEVNRPEQGGSQARGSSADVADLRAQVEALRHVCCTWQLREKLWHVYSWLLVDEIAQRKRWVQLVEDDLSRFQSVAHQWLEEKSLTARQLQRTATDAEELARQNSDLQQVAATLQEEVEAAQQQAAAAQQQFQLMQQAAQAAHEREAAVKREAATAKDREIVAQQQRIAAAAGEAAAKLEAAAAHCREVVAQEQRMAAHQREAAAERAVRAAAERETIGHQEVAAANQRQAAAQQLAAAALQREAAVREAAAAAQATDCEQAAAVAPAPFVGPDRVMPPIGTGALHLPALQLPALGLGGGFAAEAHPLPPAPETCLALPWLPPPEAAFEPDAGPQLLAPWLGPEAAIAAAQPPQPNPPQYLGPLPLLQVQSLERCGPWRRLELLGVGATGRIYSVRHVDGREAALKILRLLDDFTLERGSNEADFLARGVINCLQLGDAQAYCAWAPGRDATALEPARPACWEAAMVVPLMTGGDVEQYSNDLAGQPVLEEQLKAFAVRGIAALADLHGQGLAHADIKPANMLLMSDPGMGVADITSMVIADFDLAVDAADKASWWPRGTLHYMSPEVFEAWDTVRHDRDAAHPECDASKQDLFSFGLVMAQLMGLLVDPAVQYPAIPPPCGAEVLCFDEAQMGVLVEHYKRRREVDAWSRALDAAARKRGFSGECIHFVTRLLDVEPTKRLSAAELMDHPFLRDE